MPGGRGLVATFLLFSTWIFLTHGLRVQGIIKETSTIVKWVFIDRFCFLSEYGHLEYDFLFPKAFDQYIDGSFQPQNILLYFDNQWEKVYPGEPAMTCDDRLSVLRPENHQVINLTTRYHWSGCTTIEKNTGAGEVEEYLRCRGGRTFTSRRPRWWYIVVANCGSEMGINLGYELNMTNSLEYDIFRHHMSADEYYILEELIVGLISYFTMSVLTICVAVALTDRQLFHTTYKLFMTSVGLMFVSIVCQIVYWVDFGQTGLPKKNWKNAGRFFDFVSHCIFLVLLILMSKGFTITRARIRPLGVIKLVIFVIGYLAATIAMFFWEQQFDKGLVLYFFQSIPGYVILSMKILAWGWCHYGVIFTVKHYPEKRRFYIPFAVTLSLWFWLGPIMILIANFAMPAHMREKVIHGILLGLSGVGHVIFLILTWPTHASSTFPYHIRTTQIGAMPASDGNTNAPAERGAYAPSTTESSDAMPAGEGNFLAMFGAADAQTATRNQRSTSNGVVNPENFPHETRSPLQPDS